MYSSVLIYYTVIDNNQGVPKFGDCSELEKRQEHSNNVCDSEDLHLWRKW